MGKALWRGQWYVYNHVRREFVRDIHGKTPDGARYTPSIRHARAYKNPSLAQKAAYRLNVLLHHPGSGCWPCQPVSVVTGEAARCLDLINQRERGTNAKTAIHHPRHGHGRVSGRGGEAAARHRDDDVDAAQG